MSLQDRMQTDPLWIRTNGYTQSGPKARTHGYNYIYYSVPNHRERIQMIYRSMAKQYDWQMQKFRLGKKFPDRGNKKRFIKNVFRFLKNPLGYYFWKTFHSNSVKSRSVYTFLGVYILVSLFHLKRQSSAKHAKTNYLMRSGRNCQGIPGTGIGMGSSTMYAPPWTFYELFYYRGHNSMVHINPVWRQGFRKQFQMLNSYKTTV